MKTERNIYRCVIILTMVVVLTAAVGVNLSAGGMEESGSGSVEYMAQQGRISEPETIITSSFISSIDYNYPDPENDFGISIYLGNKQIPVTGSRQIAVIGLQGARKKMKDLPPMNLCFVIDHSGSMSGENKMAWVKSAFDVFIDTVREIDYVSIVKFDDTAETVFPSTRITDDAVRSRLREAVYSINPEGGTNLVEGLKLGYQEVMTNFRDEYTNRVLFLTDGVGESEGMNEMAGEFRQLGINVSTIGLGSGFNGELLRSVAKSGGGSSRFISDQEALIEMFGPGLSRMVVPAATELTIDVNLPSGGEIVNTWAYEYSFEGTDARYSYPAIHIGDYETIVLEIEFPPFQDEGKKPLVSVTASYLNPAGEEKTIGPVAGTAVLVPEGGAVDGYSEAIVLRAGTIVTYAETLKQIGNIYYSATASGVSEEKQSTLLGNAFSLTNKIKKELLSVEERLEFKGFSEELAVLEAYLKIIGNAIDYSEETVENAIADREPELQQIPADFTQRINSLFHELSAGLAEKPNVPLVISGFSFKDEREAPILDYLTNSAETFLVQSISQPVVSRQDLTSILDEQKLSLSGLFETDTAIEVGKLLAARYMITGTVIEMNSSVIIFSRIIDVESAQILGASQIIVDKDNEVLNLL